MKSLDDHLDAVLEEGAPGAVVLAAERASELRRDRCALRALSQGPWAPLGIDAPRRARAHRAHTPALFAPRGVFYTGSNYVVLGLLVEETTGETLREELRRRIIDPLGLADTDLPGTATTAAGLARGYFPAENPLLPDPGPDPIDVTDIDIFSWGGGGMVSTARDVARFLRALLGGELLPPAMRAELLTTVASDWEESAGYGLGIEEVTSLMGQAESLVGLPGATSGSRPATRRSHWRAMRATGKS